MQLTRLSGIISQIAATPDKHGDVRCVVDGKPVSLASDFTDQVHDGDQVTLAGEQRDDTIYALAMNNGRDDRCLTIDGSNMAIIWTFATFVGIITGILALQEIGTGEDTALTVLSVISIAALGYAASLLLRIFRINRASRIVQYG